MTYFEKGVRSFYTGSMESIGQRATKLPALKVGDLRKKSADSAITAKACASVMSPGSSGTGVKTF